MARIKFRITAKTDVGLVRTNNEDNYQASSDLLVKPMRWVNNEVCQLGEKGALLVVADGMGGMNAGEVASQIAINTVREEFAPAKLTPEIMKSRFTIEKYMNNVIVKADENIKETAKKNPETKGMGTTIVIAWLLDDMLYVSWCGDSRAYIYNPKFGLHRLSKDHSYVQQLVDAGKLSEEEAFDFPDSNIITRCLSDSNQKALPESLDKPYKLSDNDVILLCTDGLCGMIQDMEIAKIIESNVTDLGQMADILIQAALGASGADNVTVCLCQIISGGGKADPDYFLHNKRGNSLAWFSNKNGRKSIVLMTILLCLLFLIIGGMLSYFYLSRNYILKSNVIENDSLIIKTDTTSIDPAKEITIENLPEDESMNSGSQQVTTKAGLVENSISGIDIPNTDKKEENTIINNTSSNSLTKNSKDEIQEEVLPFEETRDVVKERLPEGVSLQQFANQHGMNQADMKRLNPDIRNWRAVQPGTVLNVYKN